MDFCAKIGYLNILILLLQSPLQGQSFTDFRGADSVTYSQYIDGKWDELIIAGEQAISKGIDYKFLRQRLGIAWFSKGDYFRSRQEFKKALSFDSFDTFTTEYLCYTYLNTIQSDFAFYYFPGLPAEAKRTLDIRRFSLIENIDIEISYKYAATNVRSDPKYIRMGILSRPLPRLGLYQMASYYNQSVLTPGANRAVESTNRQTEYYALARYNLSGSLIAKAGWHHLAISNNGTGDAADLGFAGLSAAAGRFTADASYSFTRSPLLQLHQYNLAVTAAFGGSHQKYLQGTVSLVSDNEGNRTLFGQKAGFQFSRSVWIEASATEGDMNYYNDFDALYVYNAVDPAVFRGSLTSFIKAGNNVTLWLNCGYEKKRYYINQSRYYNQFGYLAGIRIRL